MGTPYNPYERFDPEKLILRDELAVDRTRLANERTFLAYARTCLALAAVAGTCLKFFPESTLMISVGIIMFVIAVVSFLLGGYRTLLLSRQINRIRETLNPEENYPLNIQPRKTE